MIYDAYVNDTQKIPAHFPALPPPAEGWDRWIYLGTGVEEDGPLNRPWAWAFPHDRSWNIDWRGTDDWPNGQKMGVLVAARDNSARESLSSLLIQAKRAGHTIGIIDEAFWAAVEDAELTLNQ